MDDLIALQPTDLLLVLALVAISLGLALWQQLGLTGQLALATVRALLQLFVMGYLLSFLLAWQHPIAVLSVSMAMLLIAAIEASHRIGVKIPYLVPLLWGALFVGTGLTLTYTLGVIIQPQAWSDPRYLIPLTSLVIGNAMNGAAIAGERLTRTVAAHRQEIETHLCLGATPAQAVVKYRRDAIRAGLIPTLNAMMTVGLARVPEVMAGQLLSGIEPLEAASYEILIVFMLTFATLTTTLLVIHGLCRQYFNQAAQLQSF